jgi:hypothetical protein
MVTLVFETSCRNHVPCGKLKANQLINELIDEGYIEMMRSKGRYIITEKGLGLLKKMSLES